MTVHGLNARKVIESPILAKALRIGKTPLQRTMGLLLIILPVRLQA